MYADNCFFDSPDPDMPVRGLRKYVDAISNLFESRKSSIDLLDLKVLDNSTILAQWRLEGTLLLPWRPKFKAYTGCTIYALNEQGLIHRHVELWSISAFDAFVSTLFPQWPYGAAPAPSTPELLKLENHGVPDHTPLIRESSSLASSSSLPR